MIVFYGGQYYFTIEIFNSESALPISDINSAYNYLWSKHKDKRLKGNGFFYYSSSHGALDIIMIRVSSNSFSFYGKDEANHTPINYIAIDMGTMRNIITSVECISTKIL